MVCSRKAASAVLCLVYERLTIVGEEYSTEWFTARGVRVP